MPETHNPPCARDPRVDPKAGDILGSDGGLLLKVVLAATRGMVYYRFSTRTEQYGHTKTGWRRWAKNAEVIHAAE